MTLETIDGHQYLVSDDGSCKIGADPPPPPGPDHTAARALAAALIAGNATQAQVAAGVGYLIQLLITQ